MNIKDYINPEIFATVSMSLICISFIVFFIKIYLVNVKFDKISRDRDLVK
ncbi:MAG: hypothetical protein ACKVOU_06230 [Cytophagales bacterium]